MGNAITKLIENRYAAILTIAVIVLLAPVIALPQTDGKDIVDEHGWTIARVAAQPARLLDAPVLATTDIPVMGNGLQLASIDAPQVQAGTPTSTLLYWRVAEPQPSPIRGKVLALSERLFDDDAVILDRPASKSVRYAADSGPSVEMFFRQGDGTWLLTPYTGIEAVARFRCLGVELPLAEAYADVEFPPAPPDDAGAG